jgi:hypothetical protein
MSQLRYVHNRRAWTLLLERLMVVGVEAALWIPRVEWLLGKSTRNRRVSPGLVHTRMWLDLLLIATIWVLLQV